MNRVEEMLKLWLVSRLDAESYSYDDYIAFVVCAESKEAAIKLTTDAHPYESYWSGWLQVDKIHAELIGIALNDAMPGIILDSFNAG